MLDAEHLRLRGDLWRMFALVVVLIAAFLGPQTVWDRWDRGGIAVVVVFIYSGICGQRCHNAADRLDKAERQG